MKGVEQALVEFFHVAAGRAAGRGAKAQFAVLFGERFTRAAA